MGTESGPISRRTGTATSPRDRTSRRGRLLLALTVVHPVPSFINAILVATLVTVAGGTTDAAMLMAVAMLGYQFSIGALNDITDREADRLRRTPKPIPAGLVQVRAAAVVVVIGGAIGMGLSATFGIAVLLLGLSGYACGVAYDVALRRMRLGWLCYALAFPILLVWSWMGAVSSLPPGWPFLLPVAALAGPALHIANSLVDTAADEQTGQPSLATQLGARRARWTLAALMTAILVLAWATMASIASLSTPALVAGLSATTAIALGVGLSWLHGLRAREAGWVLQAVGLALLVAAWLTTMAAA